MNENFMKKTTIFVVDNNSGELSFEIEGMLTSKVKSIHYFKDPAEALKEFDSIMPQIVIADLKLAMMDIVDFSSKIKNMNVACELIVALGFVEPHRLVEMVNMGIHRFVLKPLSVPKLTDAVLKAMDAILEKAVSFQTKYMQEILNAEDNPVFATDGVTVLKANRSFLECFGAKSLSQFYQTYPDLSAVFLSQTNSAPSLGWLKEFILESEEPKALIYDNRKGDKRVFLLHMGNTDAAKNYFVVTMTDITDIETIFSRKIEMLSSQISSKERVKFRSMLEFEIARCRRYKKVFSLLLIGFDMENDSTIEEWELIFKIVRKTLRSSDLFAKVDKNQLAVIATETCKDGAKRILQRLQNEFEKLRAQGRMVQFKGSAAEFCEDDTVTSIFKKAASGI